MVDLVPAEPLPYYHLALLLVQAGDLPAYDRHCERIMRQFADTRTPMLAVRMAKACLILPPPATDLELLDKMVGGALAPWGKREPPDDFKFVKGLAEFREGHFASAAQWLQKVEMPSGEPWRAVQVSMVLAMAQWRLDQRDAAQAALAKGIRLADANTPKTKNRDLGTAWSDWIIAQALMREAKTLIEHKASAEGHQ